MLKRIKPERIAGIVALSYLVLIPAAAFVAHRKIHLLQQDVEALWENADMADVPRDPLVDATGIKRFLGLT